MTTIFLYGELAEKFGPVWKLAVNSVGEAIRAIEANRPGLIAYLDESGGRGVDFNVKVNEVDTCDRDQLAVSRRIDTIRISPVVRGSKDSWVGIVIGVVLIIVAVICQQYELLPGIMSGMAGGAAGAGLFGGVVGTMVGMIGVSMVIGGVAQMIAGTPKLGGSGIQDGGTAGALFNGPENTTTQGGPVPLCYGGPILVGSQVISAGITTEDTSYYDGTYLGNEWDPWAVSSDGQYGVPSPIT
jgi:predicted phage tail protein